MFPLNNIYFPVFESLTCKPILSASGSLARTMSASTFSASSNASLNAFGSSGFGYSSVGKSPFGSFCSSTTYMFLNPISFNILFANLFPVPFNGVYTILKSSATCSTASLCNDIAFKLCMYLSSISLPIIRCKPLSLASSSDIIFIIE